MFMSFINRKLHHKLITMLKHLSKYHSDWIRIAFSLVGNKEEAEDIIQDMYIRMHDKGITYDDIRYGKDDVNRYFIYLIIRNMSLDLIRKKHLDIVDVEYDHPHADEYIDEYKILDDIQKEVDSWDYYDKTLFEVYMYSGLSYRDLAYGSDKDARRLSRDKDIHIESVRNGTGISVSSMFNTIKKCKERLKLKFTGNENRTRD